jgi:Mg-chelatase subunit ChlD
MQGNELARLRLCVVIAIALASAGCSGDDEGGADSGGEDIFGNSDRAGTGGGTDDDGDGYTGEGCADGLARTSRVTPRVILVVDGSCSMSTDYPSSGPSATMCDNNDNSRWSALREALLDGQDGVVTRLAGLIEFGLVVFGTQRECPITGNPIDPALDNREAIDSAFGQRPPGMFTPTGAALDWVYENMIRGQRLDTDDGPEIVILATDGEPNSCGDAETNYQPSVDALMKGQGLGVTTYVISLAGAAGEFHDHLQQLATIGGGPSARLYEPGTPEQLAADLELLIGGSVGCDVALNGVVTPGMECAGTVRLNGEPLECNGDDGWVLVDARHIRVQGEACQRLMSSNTAQLQANFPCGVFMVD